MTLLAIGAHPDDVELGCGGSLAVAAARGDAVTVADLTRGELASAGTPAARAAEAVAAARLLGAERTNLELPDTGLRHDDPGQLRRLVELVRRVRPRLLLVPAAGDRHPDHREAHELARRAAFLAALERYPAGGVPHRVEALLYYPSVFQTLAQPAVVVDITACRARKLAAIACYGSQLQRRPQQPATPLHDPELGDWLAARDRAAGRLIGVAYGEGFGSERPPRLAHPLAFLGQPAADREERSAGWTRGPAGRSAPEDGG